LEVAFKYDQLNPLILILADEKYPGGTLVSNCQEEVLFRRTMLYSYLQKELYPLSDDELILIKNVGIINRDLNDSFIKKISIIRKIDFVALPCVRSYTNSNQTNLKNILKNKLRLLFQVCIKHNYKSIILGVTHLK
jgi:hypothetical protein